MLERLLTIKTIERIEHICADTAAMDWEDIKQRSDYVGELAAAIVRDLTRGSAADEIKDELEAEGLEMLQVLHELYMSDDEEINEKVEELRINYEKACIKIIDTHEEVQEEIKWVLECYDYDLINRAENNNWYEVDYEHPAYQPAA